MAACKTSALKRVWRLLPLLSFALLSSIGWAAREVPVFVVDVSAQTPAALQQALRAALVRATGRRESATDPAFAPLVANASKYVKGYQPGPKGELQVAFDGEAIDQIITGLGRSTWDPDRPFTLIVLNSEAASEQNADQAALEQEAEARGLPISIVPLTVRDASGRLLPRESLLALVHNFGAEQLLIGQPVPVSAPSSASTSTPAAPAPIPAALTAPAAGAGTQSGAQTAPAATGLPAPPGAVPVPPQPWQWTLVTAFMEHTFTGALTAGIDGTVDLLAPPPHLTAADRSGSAEVRILGVSSLGDYARLELMLAAMPGVSRAGVEQVHGDSAVFDLVARGGADAVGRTLSHSPHFSRVAQAGGGLVFRYLPASPQASSPAAQP